MRGQPPQCGQGGPDPLLGWRPHEGLGVESGHHYKMMGLQMDTPPAGRSQGCGAGGEVATPLGPRVVTAGGYCRPGVLGVWRAAVQGHEGPEGWEGVDTVCEHRGRAGRAAPLWGHVSLLE